MDIYVTDTKYGPQWFYEIWVDGEVYDSFFWTGLPLTWSQQWDVAEGYREGLTENTTT